MGLNHQFFVWARTTNLLGGLEPPTFLVGSNHQPFGWARTTNFSGGLEPPTFWVGSNHQLFRWAQTTILFGGLEPPTKADEEGRHTKFLFFQHDQIFAKVSFTKQKQLELFFLNKKNAKLHLDCFTNSHLLIKRVTDALSQYLQKNI